MLETVDDPKKRAIVAAVALDVAKSDHDFTDIEMAVFAHMLRRWNLTLEDLQSVFAS